MSSPLPEDLAAWGAAPKKVYGANVVSLVPVPVPVAFGGSGPPRVPPARDLDADADVDAKPVEASGEDV